MYYVNRPYGRAYREGTAAYRGRPRPECIHPCIAYIHSRTAPHRLAHTSDIRTVSEAYWLVLQCRSQAAGDPTEG